MIALNSAGESRDCFCVISRTAGKSHSEKVGLNKTAYDFTLS